MGDRIAIIGVACRYPDADSPRELWVNALAQRRAFRRLPRERLALDDYWSAERTAPDVTYSTMAAVLDGYRFDRVRFRVGAETYHAVDLAHWLALDVADAALADAGFDAGRGLPRATTGALVGNTLTGDLSRANGLRLRWPYVRRVIDAALVRAGDPPERRRALLAEIEASYKAPFPEVDGETLAGSLSNTIAGRICNYFDLKGGGYTVDGACASSLLAVAHACDALSARTLDVAIAGGVDVSLDPLELVGFAKAGALADGAMRVFDAHPTGFWPGEGCGFVVLMREADALARGRHIYAVICGVGVSSDGSGGMTRPQVDGQMLALARAYANAGFDAATVPYFEAHGTGTAAGDATELAALARSRLAGAGALQPAVISSVKANIGHTKAAAGIAALLKAAFAVDQQVRPPATGCEQFLEFPGRDVARLATLDEAEPWPETAPLRAGVSAMGFGGINAHVALEAPPGVHRHSQARQAALVRRRPQDAELFVVSAGDRRELGERLEHLRGIAGGLSFAELTDLAVHLQRNPLRGAARAALVAASPTELEGQLARACAAPGNGLCDSDTGLFVGEARRRPRIALLFTGQGAAIRTNPGLWGRRFDEVGALYRRAALVDASAPDDTAVAQPAIVTAALAAAAVLQRLGVDGETAVGHSVGEIAALAWSHAITVDDAIALAARRGRLMKRVPGAMAAVAAPLDVVAALVAGTAAAIAAINAPTQVVISGDRAAIDEVITRGRSRGVTVTRLPVAHPFHSELMRTVAPDLARALATLRLNPPRRHVISTVTGAPITPQDDITDLLVRQLSEPVRFLDAVRAAGPVDLFVELGPGRALATLAAACTGKPAVAVDAAGASLRGLLSALAGVFALGADLDLEGLSDGRGAKPFDPLRARAFVASPCERDAQSERQSAEGARGALTPPVATVPANDAGDGALDTCDRLRQLVAQRTELPLDAIAPDSRFLSDLHLNSLTVAELMREASVAMGCPPLVAPTDYADATVRAAAEALEGIRNTATPVTAADAPPGVDAWVRAFAVRDDDAPPLEPSASRSGEWTVVAGAGHPLRDRLVTLAATSAGGPGTIVCVDRGRDCPIGPLLEAAQRSIRRQAPGRFVIVQPAAGLSGFARTLQLEAPQLDVAVLTVDFDDPQAADRVWRDAQAVRGFLDVRYEADGRRLSPVAELLPLDASPPAPTFGADDVLLITGGGKGIGAECALAVARDTGARLAILGRSSPEHDDVLAGNLERLKAAGLTVLYVRADVGDAAAVNDAVACVTRTLGPVTAILHAAGVNRPALIAALDDEAVAATLRPKVDGARHLLAAIDRTRLRVLVTFGSVIARTGLAGEAHYALANERLRELTAVVAAELPHCRAMAVEWSVWAAAGMGERLGRIESLARSGVEAIDVASGTDMLRRLLAQPSTPSSAIVAGRLGPHPALPMAGRELPFRRFLERPRVHWPGVELVADAELGLASDPYLADHQLDGQRVVPATIGLEAIAQCAMALRRTAEPPHISSVELARAIVVPRDGSVVIRTAALADADGSIRVVVRSSATSFAVDHFLAVCCWPGRPAALDGAPGRQVAATVSDGSEPLSDLYGSLFFQSGRFARVRGYRELCAMACDAEIGGGTAPWFGPYLPDTLVLGDPGARDAALHCVQACVPHRRVIPVAVGGIQMLGPLTPPCRVRAMQIAEADQEYRWNIDILDATGACVERWQEVRFRAVASLPAGGLLPLLVGPYLERQLPELGHAGRPRVLMLNGSRSVTGRDAIRRLLGPSAAVHRRPDGKPEAAGAEVSIAHAEALTLVVAADAAVGCDLETVRARSPELWHDLLGPDRARVGEIIAHRGNESADAGATRVWAAIESLKKAGAPPAVPMALDGDRGDGWVTLRAGRYTVSTWLTTAGTSGPLALAIVTGEADARV